MSYAFLLVYGAPLAVIWGWYLGRRQRAERTHVAVRDRAVAAGLAEPVSLHPVIDALKCIGCGSCVKACPEQPEHHVLGLIGNKAQLVSPSDCIGHGACRTACPADAISLVFGSAKRGVDIPLLSPDFETSVPGIYIAGELGGMGLIRNALAQGKQAVDAIHGRRSRGGDALDLVIVGAGPAGLAASLTAMAHGMKFATIEQESLGGSVFQYPRAKLVMTSPVTLPLAGKMRFGQTSKEALLGFWQDIESKAGLQIRYRERVEAIQRQGSGFVVRTTKAEYRTSSVLLAIGRRGTPRKLGVAGEELPKVVYRLIDPEQYAGQDVLVVGGGDSALEAALSIAESGARTVTLSYRGEAFARAKPRNRERTMAAMQSGRIEVLFGSEVKRIERDSVLVARGELERELPNDAVIVSAGGILPADFLRSIGVDVETKYGTA
ncbi:MAG: 4Fe-4S dicluster domain-containing protein [Gammaproteobacteria bacterium]|nr:4Fe-4S dicluster domain-containing protein [Gammaproteobacteria bacterium]